MLRIIICLIIHITTIGYALGSSLPLSDRNYLSRAAAEGRSNIIMLIAAKENMGVSLKDRLESENISINYHDLGLGYFRITAPRDKVVTISQWSEVEASGLARKQAYFYQDADLDADTQQKPRVALSTTEYAQMIIKEPRYDGRALMGLTELWKKNPEYDGRGVTIAVIEWFFDADVPELREALDSNGIPIRKVTGMYAVDNEELDDMDTGYGGLQGVVRLSNINSTNGVLHYNGKKVKVKEDGNYNIGVVDERNFRDINQDLNKDGNPREADRIFLILKKNNSDCYYVDINQNYDIRDDECFGYYNNTFRGYSFANQSRQTEGVRFFLVPSTKSDRVIVGVANEHTQSVAVTAAGRLFWNTFLGGSAPNAQLINIASSGRIDSNIESMIMAAKNEKVDIILMMFGSVNPLNDDSAIQNIISNRISDLYRKILIVPAGNTYQIVNSINDASSAGSVISVGQYYGAEINTFLLGYSANDRVPLYSAGGPADNGRLKPDIVAPSLLLVPRPSYMAESEFDELSCPAVELPLHVLCYSGTSAAGPAAAGAVAALLSGTRQLGIAENPEEFRLALSVSAKLVRDAPIYVQGAGLINVAGALRELLERDRGAMEMIQIKVSAPVATALSSSKNGGTGGVGLFETEGWRPGAAGVRVISLTRKSGGRARSSYRLETVGNEHNTFGIPQKITLPLNTDVPLEVRIFSHVPGVKSAFVKVVDESNDRTVKIIPLTVIVSEALDVDNNYRLVFSADLKGKDKQDFYIDVPDGLSFMTIRHNGGSNRDIQLVFPGATHHEGTVNKEKIKYSESGEGISGYSQSVYFPPKGMWQVILHERNRGSINGKFDVEIFGLKSSESIGKSHSTVIAAPENLKIWGESDYRKLNLITRIVGGYLSRDHIKFSYGDSPKLISLKIPQGVRRIDGWLDGLGKDERLGAVYIFSLIRCIENRCNFIKNILGSGRIGFIYDGPTDGEWFLAIDSINAHKSPVGLQYEVFLSDRLEDPSTDGLLIEHANDIDLICVASNNDYFNNKAISAVEIISNSIRQTYADYTFLRDIARVNVVAGPNIPLKRNYKNCIDDIQR